MRRYVWIGLLLLSMQTWATGITADLDSLSVALGDTVRLSLTYDPREAKGIPDLSALQSEFRVLATEQSLSYTVMNGTAQSVGQWHIVLQPKRTGILLIAPIKIGSLSSNPLQISVTAATHKRSKAAASQLPLYDAPDVSDVTEDPIQLTASVDNERPFLHQEVLYTVRLLTRQRLLDVRYQAPQAEDAIVFPVGQGRESQTTIGGEIYHVDEQMYAVFPQKSGPLTITPPSIHALVYTATPTPVTLEAKPSTLDVRPIPKRSIRTWLPSKLVRLRERYDHTDSKVVQGATVVRTVRIQAQGLVAQLLPKIRFEGGPGLSVYAGQPTLKNEIKQGALWGSSKLKVTYVFTKAGTVQLPAIEVPWFNVKTRQFERAVLPAKTYQIEAKMIPNTPQVSPKPKKEVVQATPQTPVISSFNLVWVGAGLSFVVAVMGLLGGFRWYRRLTQPYRALKRACLAHDPQRTKTALLAWAKQQWPQQSIIHLADMLLLLQDADLRQSIEALMQVLYHPEATAAWRGDALWQAIQGLQKHKPRPKKPKTQRLPTIHPKRKEK